jgi:hypothetical protein
LKLRQQLDLLDVTVERCTCKKPKRGRTRLGEKICVTCGIPEESR